jgi:hypothetical protein
MKKLLLSLTLVLSLTAQATESSTDGFSELCNKFAEMSMDIMVYRQVGVPMDKLMDTVESDLGKSIVAAAYKAPKHNDHKSQKREVEEFAIEVYVACLRNL